MLTAGPRASQAEGIACAEALRKNRARAERSLPLCVALGPGQGGWVQNDSGEERGARSCRELPAWLAATGALDPHILGWGGGAPRICPVVGVVPRDFSSSENTGGD